MSTILKAENTFEAIANEWLSKKTKLQANTVKTYHQSDSAKYSFIQPQHEHVLELANHLPTLTTSLPYQYRYE